jgi:chromate reductase
LHKNIVAISGSTRKNSSNETILQTIKERFKETLNVQVFNNIAELPHFDPDPYPENLPLPVIAFRDSIERADGVIICSPEYVFSLPAVLKNALEWMVATTIFTEKPVALIVASASGEKALEQLILIMKTLQAKVDDKAMLLLQGARSKVSAGEITDVKTLQDIDALVHSFVSAME